MDFRRATPGEVGIAPRAILNFVEALEKEDLGVHSLMLLRHGAVAAEAWWKPYAPEKTHMMFSLSKSFTSTAVGFAVQEGKVRLDDKVLSYFKDEFPIDPCANMKKMTVRHLLTMSTGHAAEPPLTGNWAESFLTSFVTHEPGSRFLYNTPASYMLSCIVQKATGEKVFDYLTPRLFEPLGIRDIAWDESPQGVNAGGFGLHLRTEDILRFGYFLLKRGKVDGRQLIDPAWIDLATAKHVDCGAPGEVSDWSQGYGFQFWRCMPKNVFRGDGAFGQYCFVLPDQDAVLVLTSGSRDVRRIPVLAWEHLLPGFGETCENEGLEELNARLATLGIALPRGAAHAPDEKAFGGRYEFAGEDAGVMAFDFSGEAPAVRLQDARGGGELPLGYGEWKQGRQGQESALSAAAWQPDGTLHIRMVADYTPFITDLTVRFLRDAVDVRGKNNVGFNNRPFRMIGVKL